jgi:hypothetical protein
MRISPSPFCDHERNSPLLGGTGMPDMQRCRICEVPRAMDYFSETYVALS